MTPADLTGEAIQMAQQIAQAVIRRLPVRFRSRLADDVMSDALFGLVKAAIAYDDRLGLFMPYAICRVRGEIGDGLRRAGISEHEARRNRSLPVLGVDRDDPEVTRPVDYGNAGPADEMLDRLASAEVKRRLAVWLAFRLTHTQWRTYCGLVDGMTQRQIAARDGVTESAVSHVVRSINRVVISAQVLPPWRLE